MASQQGRVGWIALIRLLPRSALSHAVGRLASVRVPRWLRGPLWRGFASVVGADLSEVRDPLDDFDCLQGFFTRALREGVRPIDDDPEAFVAPCDGAWGESGHHPACAEADGEGLAPPAADRGAKSVLEEEV